MSAVNTGSSRSVNHTPEEEQDSGAEYSLTPARFSIDHDRIRGQGPAPMHNPFDLVAKGVGEEALAASGATIVQYEIFRGARHADLRHDPDPARGPERVRLGLLGRIAQVLCLIEVFAHAPGGAEIRGCVGKHFDHWDACVRRTR